MDKHRTAATVVRRLRQHYPDAQCTLDFQEPWQLLVASILSAQCTDARVNLITPDLFSRYPTLNSLAQADLADIERLVRSCGLFRTKARAILGSATRLVTDFNGILPPDREALMSLPGVGRKIANLLLGDCFGIPAIVVDTHCARISTLIGLTKQTSPLAVEKDLAEVLPPEDWIAYGHLMVSHGRAICVARKPDCSGCPLQDICQYALRR
jgi:endonuclease-3